MPIATLIKAS